jgi:carbonic anhydrase/acetyltransferase-like protein (isoleucine patch superfamily)
MSLVSFNGITPRTGERCFIAPDAWLIGDVDVDSDCSVYFGATLRGDIRPIRVGDGTNIQEGALLHTSTGSLDCVVGRHVTVGHRAIIHSAVIGDFSLIGMGSTILDNAEIGEYSLIGANSLVTVGTKIPPRVLALGAPAKVVRPLRPEELKFLENSAAGYIARCHKYLEIFSTPASYQTR